MVLIGSFFFGVNTLLHFPVIVIICEEGGMAFTYLV